MNDQLPLTPKNTARPVRFDRTRFPMTEPVVETACACIQEFMDHLLVENDNPPWKWNKTNHHHYHLSNQYDSGMTVPENEENVEPSWTSHFTSDMIGHTSLLALSKWTLEAVGTHSVRDEGKGKTSEEKKEPLKEKKNCDDEEEEEEIPLAPIRNVEQQSWRNVFRRTKIVSQQNKKNHRNNLVTDTKEEDRMHQFGSEYAKHLYESASVPPITQSRSFHRNQRSISRQNRKTRKETDNGILQYPTIEDADEAIRTGALVDICVTVGNAPPPTGFFRVSQSASGQMFFVGNGLHSSRKVYLNIKKESSWDRAAQRPCITALCLVFPDRKEFVPPGFGPVCYADSTTPADLGVGSKTNQERIMLCFRLSREGNPLTGIVPLIPHFGEQVPAGYTVVERSPTNHTACFSSVIPDATSAPISQTGKSGMHKVAIFFAYRQRLENLESLRPQPLLSAIQHDRSKENGEATTLESYYCSGGSVVSSSVGRFHLLDRSTHTLLGPTSVKNRLKLIEASRHKSSETKEDLIDGIYLGSSFGPCSQSNDSSSTGRNLQSKRQSGDGWTTQQSTVSVDGESVTSSKLSASRTSRYGASQYASAVPAIGEHPDATRAMDFVPRPDVPIGTCQERVEALARLPIRSALLVPILSACYTRHGRAALLAIEILRKLLTRTAMFEDDVEVSDERDGESCKRITLLDLSVQAVCDVATTGAEETSFGSCVEFVELAIQFAQGQLSTRTIGFVLRFYLFVFSFGSNALGASTAQRSLKSSHASSMMYGPESSTDDDVPLLLDIRRSGSRQSSLPGGAPQAAALALKDLVYLSMVRLGKVSFGELLEVDGSINEDREPSVDTRFGSLIDGAVSNFDRANYTQLALHQVRRSGGSEMFWHDMVTTCGQNLFRKNSPGCCTDDTFVLIFAMLANFIKVSAGKLRSMTSDGLPRELRCKLLSLEVLLHFLECWSDEHEAIVGVASETMGTTTTSHSIEMLAFSVRRMVAPCLLWNTQASFENDLVYRRVFRIVSELWSSPLHRKGCKIEIGILVEHFAVRLLEVGPQSVDVNHENSSGLYPQQTVLMKELKKWFSENPQDTLEFFLNYDTDFSMKLAGSGKRPFGTRRKLFQRISSGVCGIAVMSSEMIGKPLQKDRSLVDRVSCQKVDMSNTVLREYASQTKNEKIESATILRDLSLDTISTIVKSLALSAALSIGSSFSDVLLSWDMHDKLSTVRQYTNSVSSDEDDSCLSEEDDNHSQSLFRLKGDQRKCSSIYTGEPRGTIDSFDEAIQIAKDRSIKNAIEYAIARNVITPSPRDVAYFLHSNRDELDAADLSNFISEEAIGGTEAEFKKAVRYHFVRTMSFVGLNVDQALRQFLTAPGFRLRGEAQKIDRLLQTFAKCFYEDNAGDFKCCPIESEEPVYALCFAIIMLNTNLHKVRRRSQRGRRKMTKAEFIASARDAHTGLVKVHPSYLSTIYDSVESCPIVLEKVHLQEYGEISSVDVWLQYASAADSELRSVAVSDFSFATVEEYGLECDFSRMSAMQDLARQCAYETWHQWHGVIHTTLETALFDTKSVLPSLHLLLYAITTAIYLDMPLARSAFLGQLWKFAVISERRYSDSPTESDYDHQKHAWFTEIEKNSVGSGETKRVALKEIYEKIRSLQITFSEEKNSRASMERTLQQIDTGNFLIEDTARTFLRSGDLSKRSSRTGRLSQCRLCLFSDVLLYCNAKRNGRYGIHEELSLHLLKVIDWFPPSNDLRHVLFEVHHPRKTFQVLCSGADEKKSWVNGIKAAVRREVERKSRIESACLSRFTPVHADNNSSTSH